MILKYIYLSIYIKYKLWIDYVQMKSKILFLHENESLNKLIKLW